MTPIAVAGSASSGAIGLGSCSFPLACEPGPHGRRTRPLPERVVLVVDDEDVVRHLTTRILADAGFFGLGGPSWGRSRDAALDPQPEPPTGGERHSHAELPRVDLAELMAAQWPPCPCCSSRARVDHPPTTPGPSSLNHLCRRPWWKRSRGSCPSGNTEARDYFSRASGQDC
jgi:hypothetical protein